MAERIVKHVLIKNMRMAKQPVFVRPNQFMLFKSAKMQVIEFQPRTMVVFKNYKKMNTFSRMHFVSQKILENLILKLRGGEVIYESPFDPSKTVQEFGLSIPFLIALKEN